MGIMENLAKITFYLPQSFLAHHKLKHNSSKKLKASRFSRHGNAVEKKVN